MKVNAPALESLRRAASARRDVALACALALLCACSRGETGAPAPAPNSSAPAPKSDANDYAAAVAAKRAAPPATNEVFVLEPATLELGIVEPNEEKKVDFKVKNLSPNPLKIMTVKTGCKCITLDFAKTAIASGASGAVHIRVVGVSSNARHVTVTVTTDDPRRSTAELAINYAVVPEVVLVPPKADFGKVKAGAPAEVAIKVTLHLPSEIAADPVLEPFITTRQQDLPVKITLDPPTVAPTSAGFRDLTTTLHLVLDSSRQLAPFQTELVFKPKEAKTFRVTSIPVYGEVRAGNWLEHDQLVFLGTAVGKPVTKTVRLYYSGDSAPTLADVATTPADFTEKHEVEAASRCIRFDVTCTRAAAGALEGDLKVKVGANEPPLGVHLTARE
jgi:hypothetical protein